MLKLPVTLAWRHLKRAPGHAALNLGGLALGIAAAFILGLYVLQELSYDRQWEGGEQIYRVAADFYDMGGFATAPQQLGDALQQEMTGIEAVARLNRPGRLVPVTVGPQRYEEPRVMRADAGFFDVFVHRFLAGSPADALAAPDGVVLTEATAARYFGDAARAVGETLLIGKERTPHRVSAVVAPPPGRTHLPVDVLLPLEEPEPATAWTNVAFYTYVRLAPGVTRTDLERGLEGVLRHHAYPAAGFDGPFEAWREQPMAVELWAQPLREVYLRSDYNFELVPGGDPAQVHALGIVGLLILLIAAVNYVNLTTARASVRAVEVGVRKTMGASPRALVRQFLGETVVFSVLAAALAVALAEGLAGVFRFVTGAPLVPSVLARPELVLALFGFAVGAGLLAGAYPAAVLARFRPSRALRGREAASGSGRLRSALVVGQFAVAVALVVGTVVVHQQLAFLRETDKGLAQEGVLIVENAHVLGARAEVLKRQLDALPQVVRTSAAGRVPTGSGVWMYTFQTPEMDEALTIQTFPADADYLDALGMRLLAGRGFERHRASDSSAVILNEAAVAALGLGDDPLGKAVNEDQHVIGVVADFHFQPLRDRIAPVVLTYLEGGGDLVVRLSGAQTAGFLESLQAMWARLSPDEPVRYSFLDDNFAAMAAHERVLARAVGFFSALALIIAAMGLLGLTAFAVERRTKEVGIRKVLGAGVAGLVVLLTRDFVALVALGFALAAPVSWWLAARWLDGFAYHVSLGPAPWALAGGLALALAVLTVSAHAVRAATADPVRALRSE